MFVGLAAVRRLLLEDAPLALDELLGRPSSRVTPSGDRRHAGRDVLGDRASASCLRRRASPPVTSTITATATLWLKCTYVPNAPSVVKRA